jgi:hypothetical protein
LLAF